MNEQVDNAEYEFLWKLLANPADPNHSYIFSLQSLVSDFPQSGALRALLMPNGDKRHLKHAAAYFNPAVLHKLATAPDSLAKVGPEQIIYSAEPTTSTASADTYFETPAVEPFIPPATEPEDDYSPVADDEKAESTAANNFTDVETPANTFAEQETSEEEPIYTEATYHTFAESEAAEAEPIVDPSREHIPAYIDEEDDNANDDAYQTPQPETETYNYTEPEAEESVAKTEPLAQPQYDWTAGYENQISEPADQETAVVSSFEEDEVRYFHQPIDDEVYEEIVSIEDIGLEQLAILNKATEPEEETTAQENHFVFEPEVSISAHEQPVTTLPEPENQHEQQTQVIAQFAQQPGNDAAKANVSRYNDDKMPYSFMWWLDKTRREHASIYQPYVSNNTPAAKPQKKEKKPVDELQQQYYESIVSTTSLTELDKSLPKEPVPSSRKEDKIIERFIQEEPQIKHPSGVKLDNENKAKRSSEDKEELVTETLARIYTEQMLYHKAILTYKKLMLKYPEKSLYFAGQIEQLESKIN